jgi:mannose-6-phosphate isomerase
MWYHPIMSASPSTSSALPFTGVVQHYAWGGHSFLPELLNQPAPQEEPWAELWMGTHAKGPGQLEDSEDSLRDRIERHPRQLLGEEVAHRFANRLPFLFKVLDVKDMLSIQVHPTKAAAEAGFAREEADGPPRDAPDRNYRDDNHKPELGVALTDFYLLHGFRPEADIRATLGQIAEWAELEEPLNKSGVRGLYAHIMQADQQEVDRLLQPLADRLASREDLRRDEPAFWAKRAVEQYSMDGHHDRGMFSIFWFNLVHLRPGTGIFQDAGIPHAYLEGVCIELMANSDNVLRGGLTPKHIDVPELMKHTRFEAVTPQILQPAEAGNGLMTYPTPAPDFALYRAALGKGEAVQLARFTGPVMALLVEGEASFGGGRMNTDHRTTFFPAGNQDRLIATADSILFLATVG